VVLDLVRVARRPPPRPRTLGARFRFGDMHTTHPS
jgi:hypothetical protein